MVNLVIKGGCYISEDVKFNIIFFVSKFIFLMLREKEVFFLFVKGLNVK